MGGRWNPPGFRLLSLLVLIFVSRFHGCWCLNDEGLILLSFCENIKFDPFGALENWSPNDADPCLWNGVHCVDGNVQMLNLTDFSLEGTLVPELGKLSHLRSLVFYKNRLSGVIPKEIGGLTRLELLDLRNNNLSGMIPVELSSMLSLKRLLLCDNRFEGTIPLELTRLSSLSELQFDDYLTPNETTGFGCVNRKFGHWYNTAYTFTSLPIWQSNLERVNMVLFLKGAFRNYVNYLSLPRFRYKKESLRIDGDNCCDNLSSLFESHMALARRRLLAQASNLPAAPVTGTEPTGQVIALPTTRSSGAFPAVPKDKRKNPPPPAPASQPSPESHEASKHDGQSSQKSNSNMWKYLTISFSVFILLLVLIAMVFMCRTQVAKTVGPWKTGLSGQLQKAFITGVPKLNRPELETACEDFSNIISTIEGCIVYKGTLSSGVEIAVASTTMSSLKDWSKHAENAYRKKIDVLSRVNHKNFVNLIGYCEEDEPFTRMMVFEYAPNGNLFEHLHIEEMEHLDWNSRIRIVMGTAYCLQYMHHELNPPVSHPNLTSASIFLTDDYAAKIAEICFWAEAIRKPKNSSDDDKEHSVLPPLADPETNVYSFGVMLLEIISGKLQNSEEHGSLLYWASAYLNENRSNMVDPTLKSFKNEELDVLCEVIKDCIQEDPRQRPTMKDVTNKLREVIPITPNQAVPRLSPLWWAELEILSVEAT
ncbi:protein MALE DISCOVERER 2-like isoform X1 [Malus sylvestris]|uniref:protein MALE DISCOVERER 2-like isoform X1 n=1 Tax=Malus sylvestris TaxID=3752 RepID=UPI0021ABC30A|nr:protein MALE DISCOVERER 2-like isoform X1 [Malus sylvestris]XP_050106830.1 protein MALE DISCOVERER 2-like isoform X1 [Malus sylvestris]